MPDDHVTSLLREWKRGDLAAREELMPILVEELRHTASALMKGERADHTLQPTALVNEAYLRLEGRIREADFPSRGHFLALMSQAMRRLLVDHARRKKSEKRGGDRARVALVTGDALPKSQQVGFDPSEVIFLDELIERLSALDGLAADVFSHSHFLGLGRTEISRALDIPLRTVDRKLQTARKWLGGKLSDRTAE
ncbi:MAG: RNA polymerase subunit sigma [bacterium]|nr:RNA polymerase subunit sigma [bacterium]